MKSKFSTPAKLAVAALAVCAAANTANAILTFDLRALSATGGATVSSPKEVAITPGAEIGSTVTFGLYAVVTGAAGNTTINETFQSALASVVTAAGVGGKGLRGSLEAVTVDPTFQTGAWFAGAVVDLNGDGDLDVGGPATGATSVTGNYINVRAASAVGSQPPLSQDIAGDPAGRSFLFGTVKFTITGTQPGGSTTANFVVPTFASAAFNAQRASFGQDGTTRNGGTAAAPNVFAGTPVTLIAVPEPSAFGMVLLGAMGLVGFRRMGLRRA